MTPSSPWSYLLLGRCFSLDAEDRITSGQERVFSIFSISPTDATLGTTKSSSTLRNYTMKYLVHLTATLSQQRTSNLSLSRRGRRKPLASAGMALDMGENAIAAKEVFLRLAAELEYLTRAMKGDYKSEGDVEAQKVAAEAEAERAVEQGTAPDEVGVPQVSLAGPSSDERVAPEPERQDS